LHKIFYYFKRLVPPKVKEVLYSLFMGPVIKYRTTKYKSIPKYRLLEKHISNLKTVIDRETLLRLIPKNSIIAEIGVDKGAFSEQILRITEPKELNLIDMWGGVRYNDRLKRVVENKFSKEISIDQVRVHQGWSIEIAEKFEDGYFDWIYIDTDHSYSATIKELQVYSNKVKQGGLIGGHDFIVGNWNGGVRYGVIEAVYQFCVENDWEIIYLTMELENPPSFVIRKIS